MSCDVQALFVTVTSPMLTAAHAGPGDLVGKARGRSWESGGREASPRVGVLGRASSYTPLLPAGPLSAPPDAAQTQLRALLPTAASPVSSGSSMASLRHHSDRGPRAVSAECPAALGPAHLCLHHKGPWLSSVSPHSSLAQLVICRPAQVGTSPAGGGPWVPTRFASRGNSARLRAPAAVHLAPGHPDQIQTQANAAVVPQRGRYTPPGGKKVFETC